jgi:hypothetical protein
MQLQLYKRNLCVLCLGVTHNARFYQIDLGRNFTILIDKMVTSVVLVNY